MYKYEHGIKLNIHVIQPASHCGAVCANYHLIDRLKMNKIPSNTNMPLMYHCCL